MLNLKFRNPKSISIHFGQFDWRGTGVNTLLSCFCAFEKPKLAETFLPTIRSHPQYLVVKFKVCMV